MKRAALIAVVLAAALPAGANDFSPRAVVSYENRDAGGASSSYLREELEISMTRLLSDAISVRFRLGGNHYDFTQQDETGALSQTGVMELRPSGVLTINYGPVSAEAEYSLRSSSFDTGREEHNRDDETIRLETDWSGGRMLPNGSVRAYRHTLSDDRFGEGLVNDALQATIDKSWGPFSASAGGNLRIDHDDRAGFERTTADRLASLAYSDSWAGGRIALSAMTTGTLTDIEDEAGRRRSRIPNYLPIVRGLWGIDETPLDSSDRPLVAIPALTDARFDVLTSINLGPESTSFQTIALDLAGISEVDQIEIVVRDEKRDPVRIGDGIQWDVYTSLDGERWVPHAEGLAVIFNVARSQYEISFARTEVRWIKVVTFGVAPQPVFVTEARALYFTELTVASRDSEYRNLSASTALTVMPHRMVRVHYSGTGWYSSQQLGLQAPTDTEDVTHVGTLHLDPHPRLGLDARYQLRQASTGSFDEESTALSLGARITPLRKLQLSLLCEQRQDDLTEAFIERRLCSANASAQLLPTLDVIVGMSERVDDFTETGGSLSTESVYLAANARITRSLRLILSGTSNRTSFEGEIPTFRPPSVDSRINADVDYNLGRALGLGATLGWVEGAEIEGLTQRYRVRWAPFGDGAITLNTSYNQDLDPYSDSRSRRVFVSPRWQINDVMALTVTYSLISLEGSRSFESESLQASLSLFR